MQATSVPTGIPPGLDGPWLITGGCGFIGTRLVAELRRRSTSVRIRVLDSLCVGSLDALSCVAPVDVVKSTDTDLTAPTAAAVQFMQGDIVDFETMTRAPRGMEVIVHLAANTGVGPSVRNPRGDCEVNVLGTLNALEGARHARVRRFVFASSGAPVGEVSPPIHEEMAPHPVSPYGASKLAGEGYCSAYAHSFGLETVALRFGNVYGPGSKHKTSVVAQFIRDALTTGVLHINGNGTQTRDFIYVDDLVEAIIAAALSDRVEGEIFQVATERESSVAELAELIIAKLPAFGVAAPRVVFEAPRIGDVTRNFSDTTKARQRLGWWARTALTDGVEQTVRWFLETASGDVPRDQRLM